jgi:hypothetical protein
MASMSYDSIDFDADDFALPPQIDTDFSAPSRLLSTTSNRPPSPIQIDEEVVVKNKRKPRVKLIDRYPVLPLSLILGYCPTEDLNIFDVTRHKNLNSKGKVMK